MHVNVLVIVTRGHCNSIKRGQRKYRNAYGFRTPIFSVSNEGSEHGSLLNESHGDIEHGMGMFMYRGYN